jgi:hypothetical protein
MGWAMTDRYTQCALDWLESHIEYVASQIGGRCESPIEHGLLRAFIAFRLADRRIRLDGFEGGAVATDWDAIIYSQFPVETFRLDFAIILSTGHRIAIECDGHDFHDRTKEQATRDKSRDRKLTELGWRVLRFTGSEIHRDSIDCARQVHALITKLAEGGE